MSRNIRIEGKFVILDELNPKYFEYIIKWRNDPELAQFLNQPFKLTMELQTKWYEEKYLKDLTQGLFVIIDKATNKPFGTIGWTDMDSENKVCIAGRLMVGDVNFLGTAGFMEGLLLHSDFLHNECDMKEVYIHVVNENKKANSLNKKLGYKKNYGEPHYPHELFVNGMHQTEYIRNTADYYVVRDKLNKILDMM